MSSFSVHAPHEILDLALCLTSGQVFRWQQHGDKWLGVDGEHWYRIRRKGDQLQVLTNAQRTDFVQLFRLDVDMEAVQWEILQRGPELQPYIHGLLGLRMMAPTDPHETLFCFLCTANNHLTRITQMVRKLGSYGEPLTTVDSEVLTRFPSLEIIASLTEEELRAAGFGYRARTIPEVARQILDRPERWLEKLKTTPYETAHRELCALPSVGPKLADCVLLYGLHHLQAAPMDTHLWQACCRLYFPEWQGKALTEVRYQTAAALMRSKFGELTGMAHLYLYFDNMLNWRTRKKGPLAPA